MKTENPFQTVYVVCFTQCVYYISKCSRIAPSVFGGRKWGKGVAAVFVVIPEVRRMNSQEEALFR